MKNKEPFLRKVIRLFFSIKGFFMEKKMKNGMYYVSKHFPDSRFMYVGKKMFYKATAKVVCPGVAYTSQDSVTCKYWQIGIFDFKLNS